MKKNNWIKYLVLTFGFVLVLTLTACQNENKSESNNVQEGKRITKTFSEKSFNSISANMRLSDLTIKSGRKYAVVYRGPDKIIPKISVKNDQLTIKQTHKVATTVVEENSKIIVTVPANKLKELKLKLASGDLTVNNIKSLAQVEMSTQEGDLEINNSVITRSAKCTSDEGDIEIENSRIQSATLDTQQGDIDIAASPFKGYDLKTTHGDIEYLTKVFNVKSFQKNTSAENLLKARSYNGEISIE